MDRKQAKERIKSLVQTFKTEKHVRINEAETRLRFIDPFFEALGWDIRNPLEVRVETALARSDSTRPDYRFLIDGKTKFFVEAKKPSLKLTDPAPIFQAKSYGFSSKVPLVILTDFEEFRPFRTLARPKFDRPLEGLIKEFDYTYEHYVDEFDTLHDTFSREAVAAGELEKRIPRERKEASQTVDKEFLNDLSKWQEELAKNIALRNAKLTVRQINEAVQRILDRIIFVRICEDRQIEESEILLSYINKEGIYPKLLKEFSRLRSKYNGLIFNEHRLSEQLSIDDKLLKDIVKNLYLPYSPYRFSEIPIEILGTIYEQYLGKVITLTPSHRAKVEVKQEVRKAGGVFYTPHFITSYIVKNTIGKLTEGKAPEQIAKMKFADIACGSGSFLLEMFDYLIRYHIDYYSANANKIRTVDGVPDVFQTSEGLWHLSTRKKKEILVNNIYGVDIDPQAVEVTQMSLYLKLLEGESAETFGKQLTLELKETILPNLSNNIKCGNSLVGMDILNVNQNLFENELDILKIRPFDWETAFPEVMKSGGFDTIVGNPPWAFTKYVDWGEQTKNYIQEKYISERDVIGKSKARQAGKINLFAIFLLQGIRVLKERGLFSYIVPNNILRTTVYDAVRKQILENSSIHRIVDLKAGVFDRVTASTVILLLEKGEPKEQHQIEIIDNQQSNSIQTDVSNKVSQFECRKNPSYVIDIFVNQTLKLIFNKMDAVSAKMGTLVNVLNGVATFKNKEGILEKKQNKNSKPIIFGKDISRYLFSHSGKYVNYDRKKLLRARDESLFLAPEKLIMQRIGGILITAYDNQQYYTFNSVNNLLLKESAEYDLKYILGILNSKLMSKYYVARFTNKSSLTVNVSKTFLDHLPIRAIDFDDLEEKAMHDRMVQLVERMLDLHKKKQQAKADSEKELFEHQIKATDKEINELVCKLYGLAEEEMKIIEQKE